MRADVIERDHDVLGPDQDQVEIADAREPRRASTRLRSAQLKPAILGTSRVHVDPQRPRRHDLRPDSDAHCPPACLDHADL